MTGVGLLVTEADAERVEKRPQNELVLFAEHRADGALDRIHILCPDPWPKARHRAHRLITSELLGRLAGKLTATGVLHLATDNGPYLETMRAAIAPLASYREDREGIRDAVEIQTDFERGFAARGVAVGHLSYRREEQLV